MKRLWLLLVLLFPISLCAQTGALAPSIYPVFANANGVSPAALGYICTQASGTNTLLATYQDSVLTVPNQNPIRLNAGGRATSGGNLVPIFLQAQQYRFTLYANGTGNLCNGVDVGAMIWQRDNVYDLAQLLIAGTISPVDFNVITAKNIDNIRKCDSPKFAGADAAAKIAACIADLPSTGGVADARGLEGAQSFGTDFFSGVTKKVMLLLGAGTYTATVPMTETADRVSVVGLGPQVTIWKFSPSSSNQCALKFQNSGSTTIAQNSVRDITFDAAGNAQDGKKALCLVDAEEFIGDNIAVSNWSSPSKNAVGIKYQGRQTTSLSNLTINADQPFDFGVDPNSGHIDADHFHGWNWYLIADNSKPVINVEDTVQFTNVTLDGYQAWVKGAKGFYWNSTTDTGTSEGVRIVNCRWEQSGDPAGYAIYMSNVNGFYNTDIADCYTGAGTANKGYYFRSQANLVMTSSVYAGTTEALNVASSGNRAEFDSNQFTINSGTITDTGCICLYKANNGTTTIAGANLLGVADTSTAATGFVGEIVTSSLAQGAAVSLSSASAVSVVSISLTAGDWDVFGVANYIAGSASTTVSVLFQGSAGSNACAGSPGTTAGATGTFSTFALNTGLAIGTARDTSIAIPTSPLHLSSTTTVCLVEIATFAVDTLKGYGTISARRVR